MLVVENHNVLPGIAKLDPLPDDQDFETILNVYNTMRFSYIRNDGFSSALAGEHQLNHSCRLEGLKHLRIKVSFFYSFRMFATVNCNRAFFFLPHFYSAFCFHFIHVQFIFL